MIISAFCSCPACSFVKCDSYSRVSALRAITDYNSLTSTPLTYNLCYSYATFFSIASINCADFYSLPIIYEYLSSLYCFKTDIYRLITSISLLFSSCLRAISEAVASLAYIIRVSSLNSFSFLYKLRYKSSIRSLDEVFPSVVLPCSS